MTPVEGHQWEPVSLPEEDRITGQHLQGRDINSVLQSRLIHSLLEPDSPDADSISSGREGRASLEMIHGSWESHRQERACCISTQGPHPSSATLAG